jgi:hypothetical protein
MDSVKKGNVSAIRTICEVHREIHDILLNIDIDEKTANELIRLLEEAYHMGKKMDGKLRQYKNNYDDGWWKMEKDAILKEKLKRRKSKASLNSIKGKVKKGKYKG